MRSVIGWLDGQERMRNLIRGTYLEHLATFGWRNMSSVLYGPCCKDAALLAYSGIGPGLSYGDLLDCFRVSRRMPHFGPQITGTLAVLTKVTVRGTERVSWHWRDGGQAMSRSAAYGTKPIATCATSAGQSIPAQTGMSCRERLAAHTTRLHFSSTLINGRVGPRSLKYI